MRDRINFNQDWLYACKRLDFSDPDGKFGSITLPHTNKIFPHHNFDNKDYQFVSTYRKNISNLPEWETKKVKLEFGGVMIAADVFVNDTLVKEHLGGYMPFSVDITDVLIPGENVLTVYVDSRERKDIPPYGHLVDYLTFGGIYRDVYLNILNPVHIDNVFIKAKNVLENPELNCSIRLNQYQPGLKLEAILEDANGNEIATCLGSTNAVTTNLNFHSLPQVDLWSLDSPSLYTVNLSLFEGENLIDDCKTRFGFREAEFRPDGGFFLNGQRVKLFGLDRHQTYPYIGAAAPERLQRQDADILKYELACNVVRTSHYPQSPHFLNRCDEIGLLVFEEITGWQHIGDEDWQAICIQELEAMIERDRNHPSIILWGVRVNESADNDEFYTRTNNLAHVLDPTRQTGGVRCFRGSSFLEDVYTYNDFSNSVLEPDQTPYLITEFAGHMFPTKIWDHEERIIEHALLHARIHNLQMGNDRISGAIGWCAFDYNTHIEFGSGDRICYHGVMDIFRLPKWAAYFYQSQQHPSMGIVLQPATHWTMGDRSGGGFNPLTIFSNCDEIEVIFGDKSAGKYKPDIEGYPNLPHPPFTIHDLEQNKVWERKDYPDLYIIGYVNGEIVGDHWIASNQVPEKLEIYSDSDTLIANGVDMTRVVFRITDKFGNALPFATKVVRFEISGEADIIGENPFPLIGGQAAFYVKARFETGLVCIKAKATGILAASTTLKIIPPISERFII